MDKHDRRQLYKADTLVNWSFIGLLVPIMGWILAGIARSKVRALPDATNSADQKIVNAVFRKFKVSLSLSTIVFILCTSLGIWGVVFVQQQQIAEQRAAEQAQQQAAEQTAEAQQAAENAATVRVQQLQTCINNVDSWFQTAAKGVTSVTQAQVLIQSKQQQVAECQTRYSGD